MICANCGGEIFISENCRKCGISYDEMIENISHDDMIELFKKIHQSMSEHKSIEIEKSLLACELLNSSLLVPLKIDDEDFYIAGTENFEGKKYILLFTDKHEYDKCNFSIAPRTNPFRKCLELLEDDYEGIVINIKGISCELTRGFLDNYFGGK